MANRIIIPYKTTTGNPTTGATGQAVVNWDQKPRGPQGAVECLPSPPDGVVMVDNKYINLYIMLWIE